MTGKGGQPLPTESFIEIKMHHPNYQYATGLFPILILAMLLMAKSLVGQDFDPLKIKGDLQKIGEPLGKLFRLKSKNGKLAPDFSKDRQTSYQLINQINSIGGNRGGGSSSSGSNWEIRINNNSFEGFCNYGYSRVYPNPSPNTWKLKLKELKKPNRDLYVEAGPEGQVSITLYGGDDPYLLRIRQLKSGSLFVQEVSDTRIFSESSASFDLFCQQHAKFTQDRFLPIIRHLGIDAPMTQFDKSVQQSVISFLTPIEPDRLTSFQTSFKNLDSADYLKRKEDAEKLSKGFKDWQDFVIRAVNDPGFSYEVRFRLMEALEKNGKPEEIKASRYAISTDLTNNPQYLVWLYEAHHDETIRKYILAQLKATTGEDLGQQIAVWKNRYENDPSGLTRTSPPPKVNLLAEKGAMDSVLEYIGQLVRLKTDGGKLQLDRDYWAQQFDNRSIQELVKETNRNLAKLNMPTNYDPDPLFELGSVSHPQAIFAKMRSTMQKKQKSSSVYYYSYNRTSSSSLNRQFNNNDLNVRMNFEPNSTVTRRVASKPQDAKPPKLDGKPFKLEFNETKDSRRSLIVHELTDGRLRVSLVTEKSNAFVQMLQKPDGEFVLQDVRGPEIFTAKAKSFDTFRETHANYCNEKLFPLFSHFGIRFSDQLFKAPPRPATPEKKPETSDTKKVSKAQAIKKIRTLEATPRLVIPKPPR